MDLALLQSFCDESRPRLDAPFTIGEYTYATDAYILVRLSKIEGITRTEGPNPEFLYRDNQEPDGEWTDLPTLPDQPKCQKCHGNPVEAKECPECHGEGEVDVSNRYNVYTCECKTCGGSGETGGCDDCGDTGLAKEPPIIVGSRLFKPWTIRKLATLPGIQIATSPKSVNWFRFDGGDGLVMPENNR